MEAAKEFLGDWSNALTSTIDDFFKLHKSYQNLRVLHLIASRVKFDLPRREYKRFPEVVVYGDNFEVIGGIVTLPAPDPSRFPD